MPTASSPDSPLLRYIVILGAIFFLALALFSSARAADLTAADETELVTAINAVNAAGAGDHSITLTADITLTAPLPALDNSDATGILLDGAGHTLDADEVGTALVIASGTTAVVQDLTITGGAGSSGLDGKSGGGIFNEGALTAIDTTIIDNTATHGAGIFNYAAETKTATMALTRVEITDNHSSDTGGGLANTGNAGTAGVTIVDSTLNGNTAVNYGGAISSNSPDGVVNLSIENSTLSGNSSAYGGGIFNNGNNGEATLALNRITLSDNTATNSGGAIYNNGNQGIASTSLINSTVSGNSAAKNGGGIANAATGGMAAISLTFTTLADNSAKTGSTLYNSAGASATAEATILAAGSQGNACVFTGGTALTSGGFNLDTDDSCGLAGTGDISGGDPALEPLALNAPGATQTHAIGVGSDAQRQIPSGSVDCGDAITIDQRSAPRPQPGSLCDIGAYESDAAGDEPTPTPTVTGTPPTPTVTSTPPTGTPTATPSMTPPAPTPTIPANCGAPYLPHNEAELNTAITCVNAAGAGSHLITLAADINLSAATTPFNNPDATELVIDGDGHKIDGKRKGTVLSVAPGTTARVRDITITGGQGLSGPGDWGGGIYNAGKLTIENSTVSSNLATRGGAIANHGNGAAAELTIVRSTLSGNAATGTGGGILNVAGASGSAALNLVNSTLSGNFAMSGGGGLFNEAAGGSTGANLVYVTLSQNTATSGGGGIYTAAAGGNSSVNLSATIITNGSGAGPDCAQAGGSLISTGYNLAGDGTCNLTQGNDLPTADALLQPLAFNAPGTTATHALRAGSPALNRVHSGAAGCGTIIATDQRGAPRPFPAGEMCDIGAYEKQLQDILANVIFLPVGFDQ